MDRRELIYLDNAATSWPKPPVVAEAMSDFLSRVGANPGRSGHRLSIEAGRIVEDCRERVATFFGCDDPFRVVFSHNVTEALNLALHGLLEAGDHVLVGSLEHNSMMRPLRELERRGVELELIPCSREGEMDLAALAALLRPNTKLVAMLQASNVCGRILPVAEVGRLAREVGALLLVDAAASAGVIPIDVEDDCIDLLAFTGHKALLGPTGTGGLVLGSRIDPLRLVPLQRGGTGSRSEFEEQPSFLPDRYESGTLNAVGLAGLGAALRWLEERGGVETLRRIQLPRLASFRDALLDIPGLTLYGAALPELWTGVASITLEGRDSAELGLRLDEGHGVLCRVGLHCAPAAHKCLGSFPGGSIRLSPGPFTEDFELAKALDALHRLVMEDRA